jgi:anti-sigma regulatory factor (Ser/Thr protein kinase)
LRQRDIQNVVTARESNSDGISLTLRGDDAVTAASAAAREFGEAQWLSDDELARLCIIIEELVANLYDHGGVTADQEIALSLESEPGGIRIVMVDPGSAFDPRHAPKPSQRPERGGGAGIDIVQAWAEFVAYDATEHGNRLEVLLPVGT